MAFGGLFIISAVFSIVDSYATLNWGSILFMLIFGIWLLNYGNRIYKKQKPENDDKPFDQV
jgi:hypothetical protein